MDFNHGIALFFIGMTLTVVGFTIAYSIANYYHKKENEKKRPLTTVQQSLKDLEMK